MRLFLPDHDEMQRYAAFHLGMYCWQILPGFPNTRINITSGDNKTLCFAGDWVKLAATLAMLPMPRQQSHRSTSHIEMDNVYHPPRGETLANLVVW